MIQKMALRLTSIVTRIFASFFQLALYFTSFSSIKYETIVPIASKTKV